MLVFYPILYNGRPATMVNLSNAYFGIYYSEEMPINLRLNQVSRIKTGNQINHLRITYVQQQAENHGGGKQRLPPIEIYFFARSDRDELMQNLLEAQLIDRARCCLMFLPGFLLSSCCGIFRYNQLYVRKRQNRKPQTASQPSSQPTSQQSSQPSSQPSGSSERKKNWIKRKKS